MQIINQITFSFSNKHRLWSSSAAVTPHTPMTSLEIIKDVIKHHQSRAHNYEHMSQVWQSNGKKRRALGYLHKHTRALASCFLLPGERSDKQSDSGDASGLLDGSRGHAEAGCCCCLCRLEKWHKELHQRGTRAFPAHPLRMGAFTTHLQRTSQSLWPININVLYIDYAQIMRRASIFIRLFVDPMLSGKLLMPLGWKLIHKYIYINKIKFPWMQYLRNVWKKFHGLIRIWWSKVKVTVTS